MTVERRLLARIDRALLAELDHDVGVQLVKVPVSDATWSTWRRLCDVTNLTMGRGLAVLLEKELAATVDVDLEGVVDRLTSWEASLTEREEAVAVREAEVEDRLMRLEFRERRLQETSQPTAPAARAKLPPLGRNQKCWCGSGKRYKQCHLEWDRTKNG